MADKDAHQIYEEYQQKSYDLVQDLLHNRRLESRTLLESVQNPEVSKALQAWIRAKGGGVLIGGTALGCYTRPRMTQDADFIFLSEVDIPVQVPGFKRTRPHAFTHQQTGVEIEVLTPEYLKWPAGLAEMIYQKAQDRGGIKVADPAGLAATKLTRGKPHDIGDVDSILENFLNLELGAYQQFLTPQQLDIFQQRKTEMQTHGPRNSHNLE
jgi:hypothetical protein